MADKHLDDEVVRTHRYVTALRTIAAEIAGDFPTQAFVLRRLAQAMLHDVADLDETPAWGLQLPGKPSNAAPNLG